MDLMRTKKALLLAWHRFWNRWHAGAVIDELSLWDCDHDIVAHHQDRWNHHGRVLASLQKDESPKTKTS